METGNAEMRTLKLKTIAQRMKIKSPDFFVGYSNVLNSVFVWELWQCILGVNHLMIEDIVYICWIGQKILINGQTGLNCVGTEAPSTKGACTHWCWRFKVGFGH